MLTRGGRSAVLLRAQDAHQEVIMDEVTALKLIETLANGVHPVTGEIMPPDSPIQNPDVLRALWLAARALDERRVRSMRLKSLPPNVGKSWTEEENSALIAEFEAGRAIPEIAALHQRTPAGILARLEKLGLATPATGGKGARSPARGR
jgi:hypothetical protein